jgi:predicted solute-binding protein
MKLIFPKNVFSQLIINNLPQQIKNETVFYPSSLIVSEVKKEKSNVGLIPTLDLIKNNDLYVSKSFGLSFEGTLCNSYIYYNSSQKEVSEITLYGDLSSVEVLLCKILFKEMYETPVEIKISTKEQDLAHVNHVIVGDKNFEDEKFLLGISFAEEMIEVLSLPFVNYVFASADKKLIEKLNDIFAGVGNSIYDLVESDKLGENYSVKTKNHFNENISSLIFDFGEQDIEGIKQIIRLPYYHGIIDDIVDLNFI